MALLYSIFYFCQFFCIKKNPSTEFSLLRRDFNLRQDAFAQPTDRDPRLFES